MLIEYSTAGFFNFQVEALGRIPIFYLIAPSDSCLSSVKVKLTGPGITA